MAADVGEEYEDMILGDDEDGGPSFPTTDNDDKNIKPVFFKETLKTLEQLAKFLACVKCNKLPMQRVYTLGNCTHKYCEKCVTGCAGRACVICNVTSYPKEAKPDLFSTSVLSEIPAIYYAIARMEKRGAEMKKKKERSSPEKEEKQVEDAEEEEETGIQSCDLKSAPHPFSPPKGNSLKMISGEDEDNDFEMGIEEDFKDQEDIDREKDEIFAAELDEEVFENTPASRVIPSSPSDPDVMAETPQHKTNVSITSLSFSKNRRSSRSKVVQPKVLDLTMDSPPPKKEKKVSKKSAPKQSTVPEITSKKDLKPTSVKGPIIDVNDFLFSEDEELFKSQSDNEGGGGESKIPVLASRTPVQATSNANKADDEEMPKLDPSESKSEDTSSGKDKDTDTTNISKGKSQNKFFKTDRNRNTGEEQNSNSSLNKLKHLRTFVKNLKEGKGKSNKDKKTEEKKELPVLTPHIQKTPIQAKPKEMQKVGKKRGRSEDNKNIVKGKSTPAVDDIDEEDDLGKKSETNLLSSNRSPKEQVPPSLTPHGKVETEEPKKETTKKAIKTKPSTATGEASSTIKNTPRSMRNSKREEDKILSSAWLDNSKSKPRAKKPKLNVSVSTYTSDDETPMSDEFQPTEKTSSRKRRISVASTSTSNATASTSFSLKNGDGTPKEKRNAKGETALFLPCRTGQFDKVKKLVEGGADVNAVDNAGLSPLHEAVSGKAEIKMKAKIVRFLCEKSSNVNVIGGAEDDTPLHIAAALGQEDIVEILLEHGASPNVRNSKGELPVDLAFNEIVEKMLKEKTSNNTTTSIEGSCTTSSSNYNSAVTTVAEDDPAVLQVMLKKAVLYFNYDVENDMLEKVKTKLKLKISDRLSSNVTHIVHHVKEKDIALLRVPFSVEYLFGLAHGMWQVSHDWIEKSVRDSKCLSPTAYEISGNTDDAKGAIQRYPGKARMNKEKGNPGLLDGFYFYLYKTCGYSSSESQENSTLQLPKKELITLIQAAGGNITNREPNPDTVDPLEAPQRFHADQGRLSQSPFVLTSHILLYDEKGAPPKNKMYTMEHVKTLRSDWVIESIAKFNLENPEKFL